MLISENAWQNHHTFNDDSAKFINRLSDDSGVDPGLLGFTFDHEGRSDIFTRWNTNGTTDRGDWDYGPFQLNYNETIKNTLIKLDFSAEGIDLNAAFGSLGWGDIKPFENGRLAARKLEWLMKGSNNSFAIAAGRYTQWVGPRYQSRVNDWNSEGPAFQKFFDCFNDR